MAEKKDRIGFLDVITWRFLVNYIVILGVTCWIPLTATRAIMTDAQGNVIQEKETKIPLYRSWERLATGAYAHLADTEKKPSFDAVKAHLMACAMHLMLCFLISWWVWYLVLRARQKDDSGTEAAESSKE